MLNSSLQQVQQHFDAVFDKTMALREGQETQALQFFRNVDIAKQSEAGPIELASYITTFSEEQETQALQFFRNIGVAKQSEAGPIELASYIITFSEELGLDQFGNCVMQNDSWVVNGCRCNKSNNIIKNPEDRFGWITLEKGSLLCKKCTTECHSCRRELGRSLIVNTNTNRASCRMCFQCTRCNQRVRSLRCFRSGRYDTGICMVCFLGTCTYAHDKLFSLVSH